MHIRIDLDIHRFGTSFNFRSYHLEVFKYFPVYFYASPNHPNPRINENDFALDIVDLSYFTARTLCSYHLTKRELYFDVIASMLSHLNFIDSNENNFLLSESRYNRLRDFSKNTRIGEMAQGINTLFVAKRLDFPYIIDFDLAKQLTSTTLNIQTNGKEPDFVFMNRNMNKLGLFESKGTMKGTASGKSGFLSDAMEQIGAVKQPCFDYSLPVCTKFENNNDFNNQPIPENRKSSINYALITNACTEDKDITRLLKLHYASWFYLVGDFDRVSSILENGTIASLEGDQNYELDTETDSQNPIYWVKRNFFNIISSDEYKFILSVDTLFKWPENNFKIGIYKKVIDNLISDSPIILELPEGSITYLRKYPDGTLLYIKTK